MTNSPVQIPDRGWARWEWFLLRYGLVAPALGLLLGGGFGAVFGLLRGSGDGLFGPFLIHLVILGWAVFFWPIGAAIVAAYRDNRDFGRVFWPRAVAAGLVPVLLFAGWYVSEQRRIARNNVLLQQEVRANKELDKIFADQILPRMRAYLNTFPPEFGTYSIRGDWGFRDWQSPEPRQPYGRIFITFDKPHSYKKGDPRLDRAYTLKYFEPIRDLVPHDFTVEVIGVNFEPWASDADPSKCEKTLFGCPPATAPRK